MDISLTLVSTVNWVSAAGLDLYLQNQARCWADNLVNNKQ